MGIMIIVSLFRLNAKFSFNFTEPHQCCCCILLVKIQFSYWCSRPSRCHSIIDLPDICQAGACQHLRQARHRLAQRLVIGSHEYINH